MQVRNLDKRVTAVTSKGRRPVALCHCSMRVMQTVQVQYVTKMLSCCYTKGERLNTLLLVPVQAYADVPAYFRAVLQMQPVK